jgi:hypothetical protein
MTENQVLEVNGTKFNGETGEVLPVLAHEVERGLTVDTVFSADSEQLLSSFKPESPQDKMKLYNAIQQESKSLKDAVNIEFVLEHFVAHNVTFNEEDGSSTQGVRIILIDDKGQAYSGSGVGVRNSLQKIFSIFGRPDTWADFKLKIKPVSKKVGDAGESTVILEMVDVIQDKK